MKHFFTIIGGMGTMATESYIHQLNKRIDAHQDQDYLNYILVNHATVPDRTAYILDNSKPNPYDDLAEDIQQQAQLKPDFFALPCNTAHYFYDDLQKLTDIPILHMPREAVNAIHEKYPTAKKVGLLATHGTIADHVYENEIKKAGYEFVGPTDSIQAKVNQLIYTDIKEHNYVDRQLFHGLVKTMINEFECDVVILGCTELSLAQEREPIEAMPIIDGQIVLVEKTLEKALKMQKGK
ncbi:MAG TPA: amino acid racemase [Candidatus Ligilactobacillus excrementigallinarum]|uniref:Amino acid racemase n=1 Tax=Candidatus Ligilactobacillus excrementigallinarum TaxID=2838641 RepID=A0A9D1UXG8_9LACO|nr:amino acid racemase [Candidatus Ligilactobacillus excrementigallinarum]